MILNLSVARCNHILKELKYEEMNLYIEYKEERNDSEIKKKHQVWTLNRQESKSGEVKFEKEIKVVKLWSVRFSLWLE